MAGGVRDDTRWRRFVLVALLAVTCLLGARGIGDESAVMLAGDMARYAMNGVFVHDLIADGGIRSYADLVRYAELYYARYPALSLGHHPPVTFLSVVPFYWVFGISTLAARLAALTWFCVATWGLFSVASRLFNWQVGAWASAIFVTNLIVLRTGHYLLSEMPMAAMVLWTMYALLVFCEDRRAKQFLLFLALMVASIYAKQLALLMLPVYGVILIQSFGWRVLVTRRALVAITLGIVLLVPIAIMTVGLSPLTFGLAIRNSTLLFTGDSDVSIRQVFSTIITGHLTFPALAMTVASVVLLAVRRRRQALVGVVWIASVVGGSIVFAGVTEPARYSFGAIPAYALLIGAMAGEAHSRRPRVIVTGLLSATVLWQVWTIRDVRPSGAEGYEAAAQYVLSQNREPAVLYDSYFDTGYFVLFTRKHDPSRRQVVLRSDKLFGWGSKNPEQDRIDVRNLLTQFGVRWIIAERNGPSGRRRHALYNELDTPRFVERRRFPVVSTAAPGLDLIVYEFLDAKPAQLDAEMKIDLPLGSRDFGITLRDLVGPPR